MCILCIRARSLPMKNHTLACNSLTMIIVQIIITNMIITITTILPRKKAWSTLMFSCELVSTIGIKPLNSFRFTWARSFSEIWISIIIINTISTVSIGPLQLLTSYQSLGLPHKYVVALISFGGDLVTPCIKSSVYSYLPFYLSKVDHKLRDFCLKSNIYSYVYFLRLSWPYVT